MDKSQDVEQITKGITYQHAKKTVGGWNSRDQCDYWWVPPKLNRFFLSEKFKKVQGDQTFRVFLKAYQSWASQQLCTWNKPWSIVVEWWSQFALQRIDWWFQCFKGILTPKNNGTWRWRNGKRFKSNPTQAPDRINGLIYDNME